MLEDGPVVMGKVVATIVQAILLTAAAGVNIVEAIDTATIVVVSSTWQHGAPSLHR